MYLILIWTSDDELDFVRNRNEHAVPTSPMAPGLDPEMIEVSVGKEEDLDDMLSSLCLQMPHSVDAEVQVVLATSHSGSKCNLQWCMKDIEEVDAICNTTFSDPPDEITPFEYLKQMCREEIICRAFQFVLCTENKKITEHK
jgi:hypothetical protein